MESNHFLNVILIILCSASVIVAGVAIPFLLQLWQTAKSLSRTLQVVNERLPAIMQNLEEITSQLNQTVNTVNRRVEAYSSLVDDLRGSMTLLVGLEELIRTGFHMPFAAKLRTTVAVVKGISVFFKKLLSDRQDCGPADPSR